MSADGDSVLVDVRVADFDGVRACELLDDTFDVKGLDEHPPGAGGEWQVKVSAPSEQAVLDLLARHGISALTSIQTGPTTAHGMPDADGELDVVELVRQAEAVWNDPRNRGATFEMHLRNVVEALIPAVAGPLQAENEELRSQLARLMDADAYLVIARRERDEARAEVADLEAEVKRLSAMVEHLEGELAKQAVGAQVWDWDATR